MFVPSDSIIQKIRSLLARASEENNDNPFERDIAVRHAHRLMEEHALSMLEVTEEELGAVSKGVMQLGVLHWKRAVVSIIASLYGCAVCWPTKKSDNYGSVYIYGRENNRITVETISDYVIESVEKEWLSVKRKKKLKNADKRSFCVGALYGVRDTVKSLKDARTEDNSTTGQGLALVNQYQRWEDEAKEAVTVSRTVSSPNEVKDRELAALGKRFGRKVRIEPRLAKAD